MPITLEAAHQVFEIISGIAIFVASWIGYLINTKLFAIREAQLKKEVADVSATAAMKADLLAHNDKIATDLRVHEERDRGEFVSLHDSLARIEKRLEPKS
jgi:hypothetical protein